MQTLEVQKAEFILSALYLLEKVKGRRAITLGEADIFETKLKESLASKGYVCGYLLKSVVDIGEFCDYIMLDDKTFVYRLRPFVKETDLLKSINQVLVTEMDDYHLVDELNVLTKEDEQANVNFRLIDTRYRDDIVNKMQRLIDEYNKKMQELHGLLQVVDEVTGSRNQGLK